MMIFSASILTGPSDVSMVQFFGPLNVAHPLTRSAPAFFSSPSTPLFRRSTMESFHETRAAMSTFGSPLTERPMWPSSEECCRSDSKRSAA